MGERRDVIGAVRKFQEKHLGEHYPCTQVACGIAINERTEALYVAAHCKGGPNCLLVESGFLVDEQAEDQKSS